MKNLLFLALILSGCATTPTSKFITVSTLQCAKLSEFYSEAQLVNMPQIARTNNVECVVELPAVRIRKTLIRTLIPMFHVQTEKADPLGDLESPLQIQSINNEYCHIGGSKGEIDTDETCAEIEEKINESL